MRSSLSIGDFSRATLLSVKTLRHYHEVGLLEPADVDPATGRRRYSAEQIPTAQVIRRFRALEMPLDDIRAVLGAPDPGRRTELIAGHLERLEAALDRTSLALQSLRDLLQPSGAAVQANIEHRRIEATPAAGIHATVETDDLVLWFEGAFGELYACLAAQHASPDGPGGGVYANELFTHEQGDATVFVPCRANVRPSGRVEPIVVPAAEVAVTTHHGHHSEADRAYGSLAAHVASHALGVAGPIREYYLVGRRHTDDATRWRTEICWPIFDIGA
ncbi:MAG: MerR family transcriptional regulator [Chloroflexi bacterium]|nr:MerR family transcriptional regulator [Chloroflexota bacterium]